MAPKLFTMDAVWLLMIGVYTMQNCVLVKADCDILLEAVMDARAALINFMPGKAQELVDLLQNELNLDLMDDEQLSDITCQLAGAQSIADVAQLLGRDVDTFQEEYAYFVGLVTAQDYIEYQEAMLGMYGSALEFMRKTGFPEFPLTLSQEDMELLNVPGAALFIVPHMSDQEEAYEALSESQSMQEFADRTSRTVESLLKTRRIVEANYDFYVAMDRLVEVLNEAGLMSLPSGIEAAPPAEISAECQPLWALLVSIKEEEAAVEHDLPLGEILSAMDSPNIALPILCGIVDAQKGYKYGRPATLEGIASSVEISATEVENFYQSLRNLASGTVMRKVYKQKRYLDAAKKFMDSTGFPNFPLSVSFEEARKGLGQTTGWAFLIILPGLVSSGDTNMYAKAMIEAESIDDFAYLTETEQDIELYETDEEVVGDRLALYGDVLAFVDLGRRCFIFDLM